MPVDTPLERRAFRGGILTPELWIPHAEVNAADRRLVLGDYPYAAAQAIEAVSIASEEALGTVLLGSIFLQMGSIPSEEALGGLDIATIRPLQPNVLTRAVYAATGVTRPTYADTAATSATYQGTPTSEKLVPLPTD